MDQIVRKKSYSVPSIEDHGPVNDLTAAGCFSKCGSPPHNKGQVRRTKVFKFKVRFFRGLFGKTA